eukprot:2629385-Prymnesium_polylepis.1
MNVAHTRANTPTSAEALNLSPTGCSAIDYSCRPVNHGARAVLTASRARAGLHHYSPLHRSLGG